MNDRPPEQPRSEPEIIPPGAPLRSSRQDDFAQWQGFHRVYIAKPGPLGAIVIALTIIAVVGILMLLLWGALLIIIPIIFVMIAVGFLSGIARWYSRR